MTNSLIRVSRKYRKYSMEKKMRKLRPCWKGWIHNWWVSLMIIIVITVSRRDIGRGLVPLAPRTRCRSHAQFVVSPRILLLIALKNRLISRPNRQTKLPCCSNHNTTNSVRNWRKNPKEDFLLSLTLTERNYWLLDTTPQLLRMLRTNSKPVHTLKRARLES